MTPSPFEKGERVPSGRGEGSPRRGVNVKLSFMGANPNPKIEPFDRLDTHVSYFLGSDPEKWRPDVPVWGGVRYRDLYPGIDLEVTGESGRLAPRMVARSGADVSAVRLRVEEANGVALVGNQFSLTTAVGELGLPLFPLLTESRVPLTRGGKDGAAEPRPSLAVEERPGAGVREILAPFWVGGSGGSREQPAVGPSGASDLLYATFLGGSSDEVGQGIAVDGAGNAYVTGDTASANFPAALGPGYDTSHNGNPDAFVVKLAMQGETRRVFLPVVMRAYVGVGW